MGNGLSNVDESHFWLSDYGFDITQVRKAYTAPYRVYHGLDHIEHMLGSVDEMVARFGLPESDRLQLHLATWFHDAVYVIGAADNEKQSAWKAQDKITDRWSRGFAMGISDMILATKTHRLPSNATFLTAVLLDADLAGLGHPEAYYTNAIKIHQEYFPGHPGVGDNLLWLEGRVKFLEAYLDRPNLYHTAWGAQLETTAQVNMTTELEALRNL